MRRMHPICVSLISKLVALAFSAAALSGERGDAILRGTSPEFVTPDSQRSVLLAGHPSEIDESKLNGTALRALPFSPEPTSQIFLKLPEVHPSRRTWDGMLSAGFPNVVVQEPVLAPADHLLEAARHLEAAGMPLAAVRLRSQASTMVLGPSGVHRVLQPNTVEAMPPRSPHSWRTFNLNQLEDELSAADLPDERSETAPPRTPAPIIFYVQTTY